jgi:ubiquinone biosynthesis protein
MVLAEGVGRHLDPEVNMWTLARPLIEEWMRNNRGPEARIVDTIAELASLLDRLPQLVRDVERAAGTIVDGGVRLHPETIERIIERGEAATHPLAAPLWLGVLSLIAAAIALWR